MNDPRCGSTPREGDFCPTAGGTTFGHCAKDARNCLFVSVVDNACSNALTCNAAGVVDTGTACGCPADAQTLGTGCANRTVGDTAIDVANNVVLRCEAAGTCRIWKVMVDCGATSLMAGQINGLNVCVCKPAASGAYYVDPSPAMATYMNGSPTGTEAPAACRLRSIKDAIARIQGGAPFSRVIVKHDPPFPAHLGAVNGEVFPLVVPPGITVTTADGNDLDPSHYFIDIDTVGASQSAVSLGHGSVLGGFTLDASGGVGTANAGAGVVNVATCADTSNSQTGTLDHVAIIAKAGHTGILVRGACALTLNQVGIAGALIGVDVARTAPAATAVASLTATGLAVSSSLPGSIGVRVGTGLDAGVRSSLTIGGATFATRSRGVVVVGGSAALDGGSVAVSNGATEDGIGAECTGGTAILAGIGISGGARFTGLHVSGTAVVTLKGNVTGATRVTTTLAATSTEASDGVVLPVGATAARLTIDGDTEISKFDSGVVLNDGSLQIQGANVIIKENRSNGIELLGRTTGVVVSLSGTASRNNAGKGLVVRTVVSGTVQNGAFSGNGGDGVDLQRTQTAAQTGYRFVFAGNTVSGNVGRGLALTGKGIGTGVLSGGKVGVRLEDNTVTGNGDVGIYVTEGADAADGDDVTEVLMDSNDVGGNLTAAASAPVGILAGGIYFARTDASTKILLGGFLGNRVHGNGRHEIGFDLAQNNGMPWNLSSGSAAVDMATACADEAKPNWVYCYDTLPMGQDVGIATASSGIHVDVRSMHFQNASPSGGRDYSLAIPSSEISISCAAAVCQ